MRVILTAALAVVALTAPAASASLEDLVKAMGADKVKTIAFSGQGIVNAVGQSMNPTAQWPRISLKSYKFVANYGTDAAAEEQTIAQLEDPPRGGGGQPFVGDVNRRSGLVGVTGWAGVGTSVGPVRTTAPLLHDLWTTPHGVIKAAQAAGAKVGARNVGGKSMTAVSFAKPGAFRATALFGADNLLVRVEARVTDFVLGDMPVITTYADYKDFDGVKFPTKITRFSGGFQSLDLNVTEVIPNAPAEIAAPAGLAAPSVVVKSTSVGNGIWFLQGGSHHSVLIEMNNHAIMFEAPLNDLRSRALMDEAKKLLPAKPVTHVVNTHHHFDHAGGIGAFMAGGATIITHQVGKAFYDKIYTAPRTVQPDLMVRSRQKPKIIGVGDRHVITDGKRVIELYRLAGSLHNDGLLVGYLPQEKILMVADAFSPRAALTEPAKVVNPFTANLWENVQRLKLDVATILPIHGEKVGLDQLKLAAGQAP